MENINNTTTTIDYHAAGYVRVYTSEGKPIWVKLSLPSGGTEIALVPGGSMTFRLDYSFDTFLKPEPGDTLQLFVSNMPKGTFILPSSMHTLDNEYRNGVIVLKFEDVSGHHVHDGVEGWLTIMFYVSADEEPGTFEPQIVGNGSMESILNIDKIVVEKPKPGPIPPGGGGDYYQLIGKMAEHVLYPDGNGGYISDFYKYTLPMVPAYIAYEVLLNSGSGEVAGEPCRGF
jgi:hypothetical protein